MSLLNQLTKLLQTLNIIGCLNNIKPYFLSCACILFLSNTVTAQKPALVEFGWDYPDVDQLTQKLGQMQNTPFDGICFSLQRNIMEAFEKDEKLPTYFELKKIGLLKWGKYKKNYIILRGYSKTGGNWFDDTAWENISKNMRLVSKCLLAGKIRGVLFDPEYYNENKLYNPWTYSKAQYPEMEFEKVQDKVRERGKSFMASLQVYKKNIEFISIWLTSLIAEEKKYTPFEDTRHALLLSFIEGMLLEKNNTATIIDGNEYAYWNYKPSQFFESPGWLKDNTVKIMRSEKAKKLARDIRVAQTVFYDGLLGKAPSFERGIKYADRWKWLEENLKLALASTENIVWFYSERINWWQENKVNDTLVNILQHCRDGFMRLPASSTKPSRKNSPIQPKCYNINNGVAHFYFASDKTPMLTGDTAFSYTYQKRTKSITVTFTGEKLPMELILFNNNIQLKKILPDSITEIIKLNKHVKGNVNLLAKYPGNIEAAAIQFY